jgi:hypothetical protein
MGRPSKFKPEFVDQARKLCLLGATDAEIADFFEVDERTIYRWKGQNEAFCQALKVGKDEADNRVERSLYQRAVGYSHPDVHVSSYMGDVTLTPIVKHYPPETVAAIFWLKNRRPEAWRDKLDHEHTGKDGAALVPILNVTVTADRPGASPEAG